MSNANLHPQHAEFVISRHLLNKLDERDGRITSCEVQSFELKGKYEIANIIKLSYIRSDKHIHRKPNKEHSCLSKLC